MTFLLARMLCFVLGCKGVYPLSWMGTGLAKPCPRCGRVGYWT